MTNPDNKLGVNAAFSGRTSPNAFNDILQAFRSRGIVSGWAVRPSEGMTISLGATDGVRDVAIMEDDIGNRLTLNNRTTVPITVTIAEAPEEGSRIDTIVGYVDNPPEVISAIPVVDNPTVCGLVVVSSEASEAPVAADDKAIREAITAEEASGATAYYVVLATVSVENGQTEITEADIEAGEKALPVLGLVAGENITIEDTEDGQKISSTGGGGVGITEKYAIQPGSWNPTIDILPFVYSATVTATTTISENMVIELYNDDAVLFANYGFSIGKVEGQTLTIYVLDKPEGQITLTINYKEV